MPYTIEELEKYVDELKPVSQNSSKPQYVPNLSQSDIQRRQTMQAAPEGLQKAASFLESTGRGMTQGFSQGFAGEIEALAKSRAENRPYSEVLKEVNARYEQSKQENPVTYTGSEIIGGVLPMLIPGVGKVLGSGKTLTQTVKTGMGLGGLAGLGYSEGETTGEKLKDTAIGMALGGGLPLGFAGAKKTIQSLKPIADEAVKTSLTGFTGKTKAFLDQLDKNPEQVKRIESKFAGDIQNEILPEISMNIDNFMERNPYAQRAKLNSVLSIEKIPENVRVNKQPAINEIDKMLERLKKDEVTDTSIEAINKLNTYKDRIINKMNPTGTDIPSTDIPGRNLKEFLQNIGNDIEKYGGYGNPLENTKVGQTLKNVRRSLDQELKDKAPDYRDIMKSVDKDTSASVRLTKQFMDSNGVNSNKINSFINKTTQKPILLKTDRPTKKAIELLEKESPFQTLSQDIKDINLKSQIEARGNQGSNIINPIVAGMGSLGMGIGGSLGGFTGAGIGGSVGGFLGGIAGRKLEQSGGKIAESVLRRTQGLRTPQPIQPQGTISTAIQRGVEKPLLDEFLNQNRREVERNEFLKQNQNRVK